MPAKVICLEQRKAEKIVALERSRPVAFELSRTPDGIYIGVDKLLTEREAQALYRQLGVMLGVAR